MRTLNSRTNPRPLITIIASIFVASQAVLLAQDMDKELSDLAERLSAPIKDHAKKKITVIDFTDLQGSSSELGKYIAEQLTVNLVMGKRDFAVLDRANLKSILAEHKLTSQGLVDPENAKKLGQFAGVDALILGTITPKLHNISLTAKVITTDTAEIVGAARAEFKSDDTVQQMLARPATPGDPSSPGESSSPPAIKKPFGDLQARVESLKLVPGVPMYGFATLTLIITNMSDSKTFGVAVESDLYNKFSLMNNRGDDFKATGLSGIERAFGRFDGSVSGAFTDIAPRSSILVTVKTEGRWTGKPGDYRPYRLQTVIFFGVEDQGKYPDVNKYNLVMDIK